MCHSPHPRLATSLRKNTLILNKVQRFQGEAAALLTLWAVSLALGADGQQHPGPLTSGATKWWQPKCSPDVAKYTLVSKVTPGWKPLCFQVASGWPSILKKHSSPLTFYTQPDRTVFSSSNSHCQAPELPSQLPHSPLSALTPLPWGGLTGTPASPSAHPHFHPEIFYQTFNECLSSPLAQNRQHLLEKLLFALHFYFCKTLKPLEICE